MLTKYSTNCFSFSWQKLGYFRYFLMCVPCRMARSHVSSLLVIGKKKVEDGFMLTWCNFKFDGVLLNLDTYRRM
jgi:hypothetical protein